MPNLLLKPVPHTEASDFIKSKPVLARGAFDQLVPDLRARAFVITGVEDANVVQALRDRIAELPLGADWDTVKADLASQLSPWLDGTEDKDGKAGKTGSRLPSPSERRAELLLRTHGFQATAAARYLVMIRQIDVFPFWQYLTMEDDHVRDTHAVLDQLVLPATSAFWHDHFAPWDWGCRCLIVAMQQEDVDDLAAADADKKPEERRVLDPYRAKELETTGMITRALPGNNGLPQRYDVRSPAQRGAGYSFTPGTLRMNAKDLAGRYDPETWKTFEAFAKGNKLNDGRTVWEWLNETPAPPRPKPVAVAVPKPTPIVPTAPKPVPAVVPPTAPAPTPAIPAAPPPPKAPVSAALDMQVKGAQKADVATGVAAVDRVHDDGLLPKIPIIDATGGTYLGQYRFPGNVPAEIAIREAPTQWPALTTAHEIGHFLDHQTLGRVGQFASIAHPDLAEFRTTVEASKAVAALRRLPKYRQGEFGQPYELWARAYAQYIAKKSGDATLLAQLNRVLAGPQPWRQWSDADFAPISTAIDNLLKKKGWLK